jgi:hypothetical protein
MAVYVAGMTAVIATVLRVMVASFGVRMRIIRCFRHIRMQVVIVDWDTSAVACPFIMRHVWPIPRRSVKPFLKFVCHHAPFANIARINAYTAVANPAVIMAVFASSPATHDPSMSIARNTKAMLNMIWPDDNPIPPLPFRGTYRLFCPGYRLRVTAVSGAATKGHDCKSFPSL